MIDMERATALINKGSIEVAPLAFMRGRTLNDSFVILDEAQNTTSEQMKMFLTRLGFGSKAIITGDITQVDLPLEKVSGLIEAEHILKKIDRIRFVHFSEIDVVRHPLVQDVIKAYARLDREKITNSSIINFMNFIDSTTNKAVKIFKKLLEKHNFPLNFLENSIFQRWAIAVSLCLILAIILAPEINIFAPKFKQGMIASRNIKAEHSFLVEDQQATQQKINDDAENIKPVYDYDSKVAANIKTKLAKALTYAAEDYKSSLKEKPQEANPIDISKSQKGKKSLEANLGVLLSSEEFYVLKEHKFSPELQQNFSV